MNVCKFKNFTKWLTFPLIIARLAITPAFAQEGLNFKTLSLEESITKKSEIITVNTGKKESIAELGINYSPEEKTIYIKEKSRKNEKGEYLGLDSRNSKIYMITPRENFEFDYITQYGFFPENEGEKLERLIPEEKNPSAKLRDYIEGKALSEIFKKISLSGSKSAFDEFVDFLGGEKDLDVEKLSYKLGEEYEVREIPLFTHEGFNFRTISELEMKIKLETNPEERKKGILVGDFAYKIKNHGERILKNKEMIIIPFIVPGYYEREELENNIDEKILATLNESKDREEYLKILKKIPVSIKKYIPQKEDNTFPGYKLDELAYFIGIGEEKKDGDPMNFFKSKEGGMMLIYINKNKEMGEKECILMRKYEQGEKEKILRWFSEEKAYLNEKEKMIIHTLGEELSKKQIERLELKDYSKK